jgi:H/ACA ribonucleoprotein complex subunit 1
VIRFFYVLILYFIFTRTRRRSRRLPTAGYGPSQHSLRQMQPDVILYEQPLTCDVEMGLFVHAVEDEMLCSSLMADKVPYFNAPIYLQNKSVIGKVDEILGPINEVYFSIKMGEGMVASSFKKGDKVYIGGDKLLPIERFLPKPKIAGGTYSTPL